MFDDIRPYIDAEIPEAMERLAADKYFPLVSGFLFPDKPVEEVAAVVRSCRSAEEFQRRFMYDAIWSIAHKTTDGLTVEGMEKLDPSRNYLFVSNHRDIVLDAAFLQVLLLDAGRRTSEITFGANLMQGQFVIDAGRSNKMFRVERPDTVSSAREFLVRSRYLSEYIRHAILEKGESLWIAQRNGRTKDGMDSTDQGIVKMFGLSGPSDKVLALSELNICPLSISYEWEPCDVAKARETAVKASGNEYVKRPGEDLESILNGITRPKGRVHLAVCEPLTRDDLEPFRGLPSAAFNREVASLIDTRILSLYRLYPNNYIAAQMLTGKDCSDHYTPSERAVFEAHLNENPGELRDILLGIYAAPVIRR